jgi:hypothetical protein
MRKGWRERDNFFSHKKARKSTKREKKEAHGFLSYASIREEAVSCCSGGNIRIVLSLP